MKTDTQSIFTEEDIFLFKEGRHFRLYEKFGSHPNKKGVQFAVWAPNATRVSVIGDFNYWDPHASTLYPRWDSSGIWEGFIPDLKVGTLYKYAIETKDGTIVKKADPFAFHCESPPKTASVVWDLSREWKEEKWLKSRDRINRLDQPISIYEIHYGSWKRNDQGYSLSYREMAEQLPAYIKEQGFTHVEFLPPMQHPFFGSWGYQTTGYFTPSSSYGDPQDLMYLIEKLHEENIGVIFDWVPSHFPSDPHGLHQFDGTYLYEHQDPKKGFHPDWNSYIFNYGRNEVRSFLISSAIFWMEKYHLDGLRIDAVASMLYLDYSRKEGEWIPNQYGGNENLEAIEFLKQLNEAVYLGYPYAQTYAEESTAFPMVSRPSYLGGLGFGFKWNMGWMHDTLLYFSKDPVFRKFHHQELLFSIIYAFSENFVLPLSHDEVVHQKGSLFNRMPGDHWQKFANLRLLYGYMMTHPGKKLLFMGAEMAQIGEWNHDGQLDWHLFNDPMHLQLNIWLKDILKFYRQEKALYEKDCEPEGFEWVDISDWSQSICSYLRKSGDEEILVICNFTPTPRDNYMLGVPRKGIWKEALNSDSTFYGGSDKGNYGSIEARPIPCHGKEYSITLTLPPLGILCLKPT